MTAHKIPRVKLDGRTRGELQRIFREREAAIVKAEFEANKALLIRVAEKHLEAEWGAPEKQADMRVLLKYKVANTVKATNLRVYDPATKRFDQTFGVEHDSSILIVDRGAHYAGAKPGTYYDTYVREDDDDYAGVLAIVEWQSHRQAEMKAANEAFYVAIRATSSYSKIVEQYPWLDTDEFRPYFARPQYIAAVQGCEGMRLEA